MEIYLDLFLIDIYKEQRKHNITAKLEGKNKINLLRLEILCFYRRPSQNCHRCINYAIIVPVQS